MTGAHLQWTMPKSWVRAPAPHDDGFAAWARDLVSSAEGDGEPLRADLDRFTALAGAMGAGDDRGWILALSPEGYGETTVLAVGWMDVLPAADPSITGTTMTDLSGLYAGLEESARTPPAGLLSRAVQRRLVKGRDTVLVDDIVTGPPTDEGAKLYRRFAGYTYSDTLGAVITFEMSTSDMTAFEDMAATCAQVLGSVRDRAWQGQEQA